MSKATTTKLTTADIEAGYGNDNWLGYGYLGERQTHYFTKRAQARIGDKALLDEANTRGWDAARLFEFCNSRAGRHYGDQVFGGFIKAEVEAEVHNFVVWFIRENATAGAAN